MTLTEAADIINNEYKCVERANACDRDCAKCDLLRKDEDILKAYHIALNLIFAETYREFARNYCV